MARFGAELDHVGQFVVGPPAGAVEVVERRVERSLVLPLQQPVDGNGQPLLPERILQPAARLAQLRGETDQFVGIRGLFGAAVEAGTFHDGEQ
jgi:hypothetical protein